MAICNPNNAFGKYCPTTCGVAEYLSKYHSDADTDLESMLRDLEIISNWTQGAEQTAEFMKDSVTLAQKSSTSDMYYKKSSNMLDDVTRFQLTIFQQEQDIIKLQHLISSNEEKMANLKRLAMVLQEKCDKPCKDEVEIQTITGKDCQDIANKGAIISGLYFVKPALATEQFLVYCEIDSFGRGFTVIQRRRDGSVDFGKDWIQYKEGFGYLSPDDTTEFWLGNEKIHLLTADTSSIPNVLRIELIDWAGNKKNIYRCKC
uniref:Fibrinogen C-terminal domain-containing protein n=1 Tax=Mola mola TaxID=94237 RepID=A0A3Q3VRJ1_MOLML